MIDLPPILAALERTGQIVSVPAQLPPSVSGVTEDSREVKPGFAFCAVEGSERDGHAFVEDAERRGAGVVFVTRPTAKTVPEVVVADSRSATAVVSAEFYGCPASHLEMVGVTGTNGKSTTVTIIRHLLNHDDDVAAIGTIGAFDGRGNAVYREGLTTPGAVGLQATLAELLARGVRRVIMEVSSHALDQRRVEGVSFRAGVFTNLSHDHLDYHTTFDEYLRAKARLVDYIEPSGLQIVNADEAVWDALADPGPRGRRVRFGVSGEQRDVRADDVHMNPTHSRFRLSIDGESHPVTLPLIGAFNLSNALAGAAVAWGLGEPLREIAVRLATLPQVTGRMERLHSNEFLILRDYAHTPDALRRALKAARPLAARRLIVVFGAGGDRDKKKRAPMGKYAVAGSDLAVLTSDNPRTENPETILDDVAEGMEGHAYLRFVDRREAIRRATKMLEPGDCLLLAGKGHETYQVIGEERIPFDEEKIVQEALGERSVS